MPCGLPKLIQTSKMIPNHPLSLFSMLLIVLPYDLQYNLCIFFWLGIHNKDKDFCKLKTANQLLRFQTNCPKDDFSYLFATSLPMCPRVNINRYLSRYKTHVIHFFFLPSVIREETKQAIIYQEFSKFRVVLHDLHVKQRKKILANCCKILI